MVRMKRLEAHSSPAAARRAEITGGGVRSLGDCCERLVCLSAGSENHQPPSSPSIWECLRRLCCAEIRAAAIRPTCFYHTFLLICEERR